MNPMKLIKCAIIGIAALLPLVAAAQIGKVTNPLVTKDQWELDYNLVNYMDDVGAAKESSPVPTAPGAHQGTQENARCFSTRLRRGVYRWN